MPRIRRKRPRISSPPHDTHIVGLLEKDPRQKFAITYETHKCCDCRKPILVRGYELTRVSGLGYNPELICTVCFVCRYPERDVSVYVGS